MLLVEESGFRVLTAGGELSGISNLQSLSEGRTTQRQKCLEIISVRSIIGKKRHLSLVNRTGKDEVNANTQSDTLVSNVVTKTPS